MSSSCESAISAVNAKVQAKNPVFFKLAQPARGRDVKRVNRELQRLITLRKDFQRKIRQERIDGSILGKLGLTFEPVIQYAGFNWRVNVAVLSAFAAKEDTVTTLGAFPGHEEKGESLEHRLAKGEKGLTPLNALALMILMVLCPPCLATSIAVKLQTGSVK